MYDKLRNSGRKQTHTHGENKSDSPEKASTSDELMQFFKNVVVDQQNDELKTKLAESVNFRRQILANPPEPIYRLFGFYFVDPLLVNMFIFLYKPPDNNLVDSTLL